VKRESEDMHRADIKIFVMNAKGKMCLGGAETKPGRTVARKYDRKDERR